MAVFNASGDHALRHALSGAARCAPLGLPRSGLVQPVFGEIAPGAPLRGREADWAIDKSKTIALTRMELELGRDRRVKKDLKIAIEQQSRARRLATTATQEAIAYDKATTKILNK